MADSYHVPVSADATVAIASDEFDSVVICTPAPLHVPQATQALAAGKHVLIEKPLSHSLDGVDALLAARARSGRQVAVAYVYHVYPFFIAARDFIARGEFGPVLHATATCGQPFHVLRPAYAKTYYRERATGGGSIQDALTHVANWVESVVGPADSVICDCAHLGLAGVTVEDTVHLSSRHGPVLVNFTFCHFQHPNETTVQFNAAGGSVKIELHRQRWGTFAAGATDWVWHDAPVPERDTHFVNQANAFFDQIEGQPARLCSLEAAAETLRFNLAALAAADGDARVYLRDGATRR